jgi:hypothetical protein
MNADPKIASTWKGRLLMAITWEDTEKPIAQIAHIDQTEYDHQIIEIKRMRKYNIMGEILSGIDLPAEKKYKIKVKIAEH